MAATRAGVRVNDPFAGLPANNSLRWSPRLGNESVAAAAASGRPDPTRDGAKCAARASMPGLRLLAIPLHGLAQEIHLLCKAGASAAQKQMQAQGQFLAQA